MSRTAWAYRYSDGPIVRCSETLARSLSTEPSSRVEILTLDLHDPVAVWQVTEVHGLVYPPQGVTVQGPVYGGPPGSPR